MERHCIAARFLTGRRQRQGTTYALMCLKSHNNLMHMDALRALPIRVPPMDGPRLVQSSRTMKKMQPHGTAETRTRMNSSKWSSMKTKMIKARIPQKTATNLKLSWSLYAMAKVHPAVLQQAVRTLPLHIVSTVMTYLRAAHY
jgi:hypothetical protein